MRYYMDTEFSERPNTIELISIGIVAEDGQEYYAESAGYSIGSVNDWVRDNVIPLLTWPLGERLWPGEIAKEILQFIGTDKPEFWGYYADYDWVVFCWLFGAMVDLPKGWPMYCRDIKQLADELGNPKLPQKPKDGTHNALVDARWNKEAHESLLQTLGMLPEQQ